MNHQLYRRRFISAGVLATGATSILTSGVANAQSDDVATESNLLKPGSTILFQGDSITDAGRQRGDKQPNSQAALGNGYAFLTSAQIRVDRPDAVYKIYNRGISGNKVHQLSERWQQDCIDLAPNVVSILIGVNDIWHWLNGQYDGTIETYRNDYQNLLVRTRTALPEVKLVICEPFVLRTGAVNEKWFPTFDEFRRAAKALADEFADVWVPFQTMFDEASKLAPPNYWAADGVHPTPAGTAMMAHAWLNAVRAG